MLDAAPFYELFAENCARFIYSFHLKKLEKKHLDSIPFRMFQCLTSRSINICLSSSVPISNNMALGHKITIIQFSGQKTSAQIQRAGHQMDGRVSLC